MKIKLLLLQVLCILPGFALRAQTMVVDTFFYTGATQTFVIPPCVSQLTVMLHGAQGGYDHVGGGWPGGDGGRIYVVMTATPGTPLYVNVGGPGQRYYAGWNGGGNGGHGLWSTGGGGGGATDIRLGGTGLSDRIFVAGGGGGGGGGSKGPGTQQLNLTSAFGGGGGGLACGTASSIPVPSCPSVLGCGGEGGNLGFGGNCSGGTVTGNNVGGGGGGMTSGGGVSNSTSGCPGTAGTLLQGGLGGDSLCTSTYTLKGVFGGGGGGGGYYGGGGGHSKDMFNFINDNNGGGGGGSTYLDSSFVLTYSLYGWAGIYTGSSLIKSGCVVFSYTTNGPVVSAAAPQNPVCPGAPVILTASSASSYTWLPSGNFGGATGASVSVNPAATTQYTVVGLNSTGCLSQTVVTVQVSANPLSVTANPGFSVCSGHALSLSASGASTFSWSGGVQNNVPFIPPASGTYSVSATNSLGCSFSTTAGVLVVPISPISISPLLPAICPGGSVSLSASGATSYSWSTGQTSPAITVSPSVSTVYSLTGSASAAMSCPSAGSIQVVVYPLPALTVTASRTLICQGEPVTLVAGGALTYTWTSAGGASTVNPGSMLVNPATSTTYSVIAAGANKCETQGAVSVQVDACTGITKLSGVGISIFPNPTRGTFYVHANAGAQLLIYSSLGELVGAEELTTGEKKELHISSPGLYVIQYRSGSRKESFKLLVLD